MDIKKEVIMMPVNSKATTNRRFDKTNKVLKIGHKSFGWILIEKYERFNLWQRKNGLRECFYSDEVPNENSIPSLFFEK